MHVSAYKHYSAPVARPSEHRSASRPLPASEAEHLAEAIGAFAAPNRLRLLWAMLDGERSVEELAAETGITQAAASQQLRVLRESRLVRVRRAGRRAFYELHNHHVPELLAAMRHHHEHLEAEAPQAAISAGLDTIDAQAS
jgi:ArsR family transcriptional regulator, nickel/cobalt-responsive transcriptional repressor